MHYPIIITTNTGRAILVSLNLYMKGSHKKLKEYGKATKESQLTASWNTHRHHSLTILEKVRHGAMLRYHDIERATSSTANDCRYATKFDFYPTIAGIEHSLIDERYAAAKMADTGSYRSYKAGEWYTDIC